MYYILPENRGLGHWLLLRSVLKCFGVIYFASMTFFDCGYTYFNHVELICEMLFIISKEFLELT